MTLQTLNNIRELAQQLRVGSVRCTTAAGSGHPTSSMSAADLMAVLLARHLRYHWQRPDDPANDHLIFSKGHASPLLYSMFKAAGVISDEKLINGYRRFGSVLQGHPTPVLPWIDVATGSLGQGLPDGVGVVLAGRYLDELPLPARRPTTRRMGRAPTTMPAAVGIPWQERASADRCHGRAGHQLISAAGNELTGSTTTGHLARNSTLAARNDGGSESPGAPGV